MISLVYLITKTYLKVYFAAYITTLLNYNNTHDLFLNKNG